MFRVDWIPVVLPTWDGVARGRSGTIGHRFQSHLCSTDVVVCYFSKSRPLYGAHFFNSAWGFFVALLIFSFQNTSKKIWISVGSAAGIVAILIVWCVWNTWDSEEEDEEDIDWPYEPEPRLQAGNATPA